MGYGDKLHGARCDVLVYGDSSAMVGVDPAVVESKTGLATCNIAEIEGVTTVMGTDIVDAFLRNNPRPRFVVFLYTPDDLNPHRGWTGPSRMEAVIYLMRARRSLRTLAVLLQHPDDSFGALEGGLRILARDLRKPSLPSSSVHLREQHAGWYPYPKISATRCPPFGPPTAVDRRWVEQLRDKYESPDTHVLVLSVPVPDCDPYYVQHAQAIAGVVDNSLDAYPLGQFSGADPGLHLIEPGVERFSTEIAERIRSHMPGT
jgi:hypothetical protein